MNEKSRSSEGALAFEDHDHSHCAEETLARADEISVRGGKRMTPVRRKALQILLESHRAMGAYEVLERLAGEGFGNQPPVAYRALEYLVDQGFAHRIRRLNAFAACMHPGQAHLPAFLICRSCQMIAEAPATAVHGAMAAAAEGIGFVIERMNIEAVGLCPSCAGDGVCH